MIIILVFGIGLSGCEKTVEITDPAFNPQLVIVSNIAPYYVNTPGDNRVRVDITQSQQPDDNEAFIEPENVRVFLTNSKGMETEELLKSQLLSSFTSKRDIVDSDQAFSLKVIAEGYDTITADTYIPKASKVLDYEILEFVQDPSVKNDGKINISYKASFRIQHQPDVDYYHIAFFNEYFDDDPLTPDDETWWVMEPEYEEGALYTPHFEYGVLLRKEDFGENHVFTLAFSDFIFEQEKVENHWIEVRSVTREYFLYHESLSRQKLIRKDPFAEPVIIFNNIRNGLGNFSGYNSDILGLPQPE